MGFFFFYIRYIESMSTGTWMSDFIFMEILSTNAYNFSISIIILNTY